MSNNLIMKNNFKRLTVIEYSLDLEWLASKQLSRLLFIENYKDSISFGETAQALSFNQKLNLLLDSRDIAKEDKMFFQTFMEIRNKFAHNRDIKTYFDACSSVKKVDFLKKHFEISDSSSDDESFLEDAVFQLYKKCALSLIELKGQIIENEGVIKTIEKTKRDLDFETMRFMEARNGLKEGFDIITTRLDSDRIFSSSEVKSLFDELRNRLNLHMITTGMDYIKKNS
ncbi:MAG: hypothetical protein H6586_08005 [Flavobacteriales bacterium]|nr:hypothetical protein [Flavobacteriales bacterium]